jgi:imidazolonepropionase-like amidohydrolase
VFVGVNVVPMDGEEVLAGQSVIVSDGVVTAVGPVAEIAVPAEARVIYGNGRWLMPGLIDMHAHIRAVDLDLYLRSGVTTVRDMAGLPSVLALRRRIDDGEISGPRIIAGSRLIDGPTPANPQFSVPLPDAARAQEIVDGELARGCSFIKVYDNLTRPMYDAVVSAARSRGVKVAGHVPRAVPLEHALAAQDSVEHLSGYDLSRAASLAQTTRMEGTWNCPTLLVFSEVITADMRDEDRRRLLDARSAMVRALRDAGARIIAGTDAGYLLPAGSSLIDELEQLHASGLTRFEALAAATRDGGEYLEISGLGTIRAGSPADLILLDANPVVSFDTLRRPVGVVVRGEWRELRTPRRRPLTPRDGRGEERRQIQRMP